MFLEYRSVIRPQTLVKPLLTAPKRYSKEALEFEYRAKPS